MSEKKPDPIIGEPLDADQIQIIRVGGMRNEDIQIVAQAAEKHPGKWIPITFENRERARSARKATQGRFRGRFDFRVEGDTVFVRQRGPGEAEEAREWYRKMRQGEHDGHRMPPRRRSS